MYLLSLHIRWRLHDHPSSGDTDASAICATVAFYFDRCTSVIVSRVVEGDGDLVVSIIENQRAHDTGGCVCRKGQRRFVSRCKYVPRVSVGVVPVSRKISVIQTAKHVSFGPFLEFDGASRSQFVERRSKLYTHSNNPHTKI